MASLDILCSNTLNLKNKITKIEHKKIFCGQSKILKNISWSINIWLKYFMIPTTPSAALLPPSPPYLMYGPYCRNLLSTRLKKTNQTNKQIMYHVRHPAKLFNILDKTDI